MRPIRTFKVRPSLPPSLLPLLEIAYNLRWSWGQAVIELFRRLDRDLWRRFSRLHKVACTAMAMRFECCPSTPTR